MANNSSYKIEHSWGLLSKKHRKRYRQVIRVISKYGLDEIFASQKFQRLPLLNRFKKIDPEIEKLSRAKRIKLAIEELGGAYVKVGQILSNRPDLIPEELIRELESLQDSTPPFDTETAIQTIETELNQPMKDIFMMFDDTPLASASIAQVHRAILLDGTSVILKIQKPDLQEKFEIDMDIMVYLSQYLAKFKTLKAQFRNQNPVKDLMEEVKKEMDFINEAENIEIYKLNHIDDPRVYIPKVYKTFTTTRVLTMEYVRGTKVSDITNLEDLGIDPETVANNLVDVGLKQMFTDRFFHGDPHPGNILIFDDGRICFLDFGLMGRITIKQKQVIIDMVQAFANHDSRKLARITQKSIPKDVDFDNETLESEISNLLDIYYDKSLKDINIGDALQGVFNLLYKYEITLSSNIYLLIKALSSYEGIGRKLYPDFELAPRAEEFSKEIIRERFSPKKLLKDVYMSSTETIELAKEFPSEARNLLHQLQAGKLKFNVSVLELRETVDYVFYRLDLIVNRLVIAIILAATLLGSSLILQASEKGDNEIPRFALVGFLISFTISIWLVISMIRSGRKKHRR